ncbi:MAG TPA: aminotransferase class III-fold pyridoxal phosphate-dependent enzyme [Acidimicrobiales bacterium]|nr:aminotransferase class III-fold pyridoxal phosphate-dependent enzyme [Acidimicrobiales bacterium]
MTTSELGTRDLAHLIHPVTAPRDLREGGPRIVVEGDGWWVTDDRGNRIIDGFAGLWCVAVGHGRPEIVDAVKRQMETLDYFTTFHGQSHPRAIELAERLAGMFDPAWGLNHVMFASGGSEANETNFKLVRMYWALRGEDRRTTIVGRHHGYHGLTIATMTATGIMPMRWNFGPVAPGFEHVPAPYCYRCELSMTYPECGLACADSFEEVVETQGPDTIAAFVVEPVIGAGGIIPPPDGYMQKVRDICDRHGILLIADEVVCGFGRTGTMFGVEQWGVRPDVVTLAKGLTSGYLPLGASVVADHVWQTIADKLPERMPFSHGFTYNGHPACCAAALANLDIIEREDLPANAAAVGAYLLDRLHELERYDSVGEVRGLGLMAGIEFVADKETRRGFADAHAACERVEHEAWDRGLYCRAMGTEVVGLAPPLTIDEPTADRIVEILAESIEAMEADVLARERSRPTRPQLSLTSVAEFFGEVMPSRIDPQRAADVEVSVRFVLQGDDGGRWWLQARKGEVTIEAEPAPADGAADAGERPDATVRASAADFLRIVNGELSGADAFVSQKLVVDGDLDAAAKLMALGVL